MKFASSKSALALIAIVFAGLAVRLFRLTAEYAVNLFFWDQWDFNDATLFQKHSLWEIFSWQHGPHRQGLGGLLAALIEPWFHWNGRTEAFVATSLVVVAGLGMLLLKYRLFGPLTFTDVAIPILVFTPAQWESLWLTTNFAHGTLPLVLIVFYCLAWTWRREPAKYVLIVALNFGILYTGFGIFIGLLTPVLLAAQYLQKRRSYIAWSTAAAVASLGSFFVQYHNTPASGCKSLFSPPLLEFFQFLNLLYATFFGFRDTDVWACLAGGIVLAAVAGTAFAAWCEVLGKPGKPGLAPLLIALLGTYSLLFCAAATVGRTCTGLDDAHSSRYTNYMSLAMLGLYFASLTFGTPRWRRVLPVVMVAAVLPSLALTQFDADTIASFTEVKTDWRNCYLSGRSAADCTSEIGDIHPMPQATHLQQKLDFLRATRQNLFSDLPAKK